MKLSYYNIQEILSHTDIHTVIKASSVSKIFHKAFQEIYKIRRIVCTIKIWIGLDLNNYISWNIDNASDSRFEYTCGHTVVGVNYRCCKIPMTLEQMKNTFNGKVYRTAESFLTPHYIAKQESKNTSSYQAKMVKHCPLTEHFNIPIAIDIKTFVVSAIWCSNSAQYPTKMYWDGNRNDIILPPGMEFV